MDGQTAESTAGAPATFRLLGICADYWLLHGGLIPVLLSFQPSFIFFYHLVAPYMPLRLAVKLDAVEV